MINIEVGKVFQRMSYQNETNLDDGNVVSGSQNDGHGSGSDKTSLISRNNSKFNIY